MALQLGSGRAGSPCHGRLTPNQHEGGPRHWESDLDICQGCPSPLGFARVVELYLYPPVPKQPHVHDA